MPEIDTTESSLEHLPRPSARTWAKHISLLLLTILTVTIAATIMPIGPIAPFSNANLETNSDIAQFIFFLPYHYGELIAESIKLMSQHSELFVYAIEFSFSLIFILTCHEAGHYIACRVYGVDSTLPVFIPTPPLLGFGTLGAFIKIKSPLPSRKATFDIGVAGPIAGFVAMIPIAIICFLRWKSLPVDPQIGGSESGLYFSDALFSKIMAWLFNVDLTLPMLSNPFYFAMWMGLLVTSLNLIPSGQLDGGHAVYAVFGERVHYWTGRIAFVSMILFSLMGIYFYGSPGALLFTVLLGAMMRVKHPQPLDDTPLDFKRKFVAVITLIIFILCFVPFLFQVR